MPTDEMNFQEYSRAVAARFLQTAVVLDDKAFLDIPNTNDIRDIITEGKIRGKSVILKSPGINTVSTSSHDLNAKVLIDSFAKKGLICGVLRPDPGDSLEKNMLNIAKRADIVILDWQIHNSGDITKGIIKNIVDSELGNNERLRLISVYTAENDPVAILEQIAGAINVTNPDKDNLTMSLGAVKITIFLKEGLKGKVNKKFEPMIISESELPETLIREFSEMTSGLLSNCALESFAIIRNNTHRILQKFHSTLDAPYLTHRILTEPADEAELHITPLIVSEIHSVLENEDLSKHVSPSLIEKWLDNFIHTSDPPLHKRMKIKSKKDAKTAMLELISKGLRHENASHNHKAWDNFLKPIKDNDGDIRKMKKALNQLSNIITPDNASGLRYDRELALLMSIRSRYQTPPPVLKLGTVVAEDNNGTVSYLLCVQPLCDSVRIDSGGREFTFLKMPLTNGKYFGYIVKDKEQIVELRINMRPHDAIKIKFKPGSLKMICAVKHCEEWIFEYNGTKSVRKKLRWIADLKADYAQRVANDYAREISRVGLTESEWLRRHNK